MRAETARAAASAASDNTRDAIAAFIAGLGFTMTGAELVGGLLIAVAGGLVAERWRPEEETRKKQAVWLTIIAAFFVSFFSAHLSLYFFPELAPQIAMGLGGFASRYAVHFALRFLDRLSGQGDVVADRVLNRVLPPSHPPTNETEGEP